MLTNTELCAEVAHKLQQDFTPTFLNIIDESEDHLGHGATGAHLCIQISASSLQQMPRLTAHRAIYASLAAYIPELIHAIQIDLRN